MISTIDIKVPVQIFSNDEIKAAAAKVVGIKSSAVNGIHILRRSIDARRGDILYQLKVLVYYGDSYMEDGCESTQYPYVKNSPPVIVVGAGPAGLFAALQLIKHNLKPVIIERGKDVHGRKADIADLYRKSLVNPDSNYSFGEGGAGTFSDGKLYTRSTKRGNVTDVLKIFVEHGADEDIIVDAHPHIGTDKLPKIIENIRKTITAHGGEYHFDTKVCDFTVKSGAVSGVVDQHGNKFEGAAVILATGHSARDIYNMLSASEITIEPKDFAIGVRVEHKQSLIDKIQYHGNKPELDLPAATYSLVTQVGGRGVFSFCMCPGGIIVPAATEANSLVVNGMSNSKRNSPYSNAGIVVSVGSTDIPEYSQYGVFQNMIFQQELEKSFFDKDGRTLKAPAQRMTDFVKGKMSTDLPETSYLPGLKTSPLHKMLPIFIAHRMQQAFIKFDDKMRGYYTKDATLIGLESRTSSPVRIVRNNETLESINIKRLFPCGEGAGYAGGIVSSAIDGINAADKVSELYSNNL
ncbi:MAG: NAD(P)/FAD-dependent oxidoreductase [Bacteroidales bacterium]|nr:NAD(P)/FAD-dependent oxidoreductase [Bacteroidales bacterium]MDD2204588.1 NAD(P)/FAD-dependent oxidoreductase [Bacteroidales bacterium]MDD3152333.1 NAD(P)/FAD-dependent oxidoreductase [Bacteroidales bacterium]MDD3914381.1 NAD(P)/FAD-dependent oxidoreductase [Bacteroidales bacterium]MDD4633475.1 NAD(P)/FAD-dependent oxidoreductase [Bacteroidales bacterium]